jgi:hypothetical protein
MFTTLIKRLFSPNLRSPLTVEQLAKVAHLSPRQFSRAFRIETGQSPAKAIEQLRLRGTQWKWSPRKPGLSIASGCVARFCEHLVSPRRLFAEALWVSANAAPECPVATQRLAIGRSPARARGCSPAAPKRGHRAVVPRSSAGNARDSLLLSR